MATDNNSRHPVGLTTMNIGKELQTDASSAIIQFNLIFTVHS